MAGNSLLKNRDTKTLSGGQKQRVSLCRAMMNKPKLLLLDEPFAGVDPIAVKDIQNIINDLTTRGIGVLITDHNVRETLQICNRVYVIKEGSILASGTAKEIKTNQLVKEHYLGDSFSF